MLLSEVAKSYEADKRIEGFSSQTLRAYSLQMKLLIKYFNNIQISEITTYDLKQYLAESSIDLKPSSLAHRIRFLKSLFRWSHEEGIIVNNPARKIKEPKVRKANSEILNRKGN